MSRYKAYAEYKDTGVEWLGIIPLHWEYVRLKYAANLVGDKVESGSNLRYVGMENVESGNGKYVEKEEVNPEGLATSFAEGNVLFGKLRPYLAKSWLAEFSGICSSEFLVLESRKVSARFLNYYTLTDEFIKQVDSSTYGSKMPRASWDFIGLLDVPVPLNESEIIANFLDHETAKIDTLIAKQQELIKLLKEKRQAVISHAVTKGLNPNAPMRDSGVEWLGEVPAHWKIIQLKHIVELNPSKSQIEKTKNVVCTFVPMEKLKTNSLLLDETRLIQEVYDGYTYFEDEDILMAKVTPCFENKNIAIARGMVNGIGFGSSEIYVLRVNELVKNEFLFYRLQEEQFMAIGTGSMTGAGGLKRVPAEVVNNFSLALPPYEEQIAIAEELHQISSKYEELTSNAESAIQLMQERRTALISAAVTGKIDVRDWQPALRPELENVAA